MPFGHHLSPNRVPDSLSLKQPLISLSLSGKVWSLFLPGVGVSTQGNQFPESKDRGLPHVLLCAWHPSAWAGRGVSGRWVGPMAVYFSRLVSSPPLDGLLPKSASPPSLAPCLVRCGEDGSGSSL